MKMQLRMRGRQQTAYSSFILDRRGHFPQPEDQVWLADWKSFNLPYCSLYIVSPDGGWPCKIGISTNARKRLIGLQTSVWKPLKVTHCYWTATVHEARALEKAIHARLTEDNMWLHGEWFAMRPNEAKEIVEFVSLVEGIELNDKVDNPEVISWLKKELDLTRRNYVIVEQIDRDRGKY